MKSALVILTLVMVYTGGYSQGDTAEDICPIKIGQEIPEAEIWTLEGEPMPIRRLLDDEPTVMVIYRGGWCPYCNKQLSALAKKEQELKDLGYRIVAVSPDNPEHLQETAGKEKLSYTLISDSKMELIDALGVSFKVDGRTISRYKKWGIDLVEASGENHGRLPVPTVLILDDNAAVQFVYANPNYRVRLDEDVLMAAARAARK